MKLENFSQEQQFEDSEACRELGRLLPEVSRLIQEKNFERSLIMIEDFYSKYSANVYFRQLRIECDVWASLIFEKAGRFSESLEISVRLRGDTNPANEKFLSLTTDIVRVLVEMDRHEDVIQEVEKSLSEIKSEDTFSLLTILFYYAQALQTCSKDLPEKYFSLVLKVANEMCPELLDSSLIESNYLIQLVLDIDEAHSFANKRYTKLMMTLIESKDNSQDISQRILFIKDYIGKEQFTYYRRMAEDLLQDFEDYDESQSE